jgi:hypothetical protein
MQEAINSFNRGYREIQDAALRGEPVYNRWLALVDSFKNEELGIIKRYNDQVESINNEAARKQLETDIKKEEHTRSGLEKAIDVLERYQERAVGFFLGEEALRLYQLDKRHKAELKAIDETIKAEDVKAAAIRAANADYEIQLAEIHEADRARYQERMEWITDQLRRMTGFASAESAWKRVVLSGAQLAFQTPNLSMTQQLRMPEIANQRNELNRIHQTLERMYTQEAQSTRAIRDMNDKLENYDGY